MKRLPASFLIVMLGPLATHASEWKCAVEFKDGSELELRVQADSERAAKVRALEAAGNRASGFYVACTQALRKPPATQQVPQSAPPGTSRGSQSEATTSQQGYHCREKARPNLTGLSTGRFSATFVLADSKEEAERKAKQQRPDVSRGFSCSLSAVSADAPGTAAPAADGARR